MEPTDDGLGGFAATDTDIAVPLVDGPLTDTASNGRVNGALSGDNAFDLSQMLQALQAMCVGNFSVRLPTDRTGLAGKIADTFTEIVAANERMAQQLDHIGQVVRRDGNTRQRVSSPLSSAPTSTM